MARKPYRSRLARKESSRLMRQSLLLLGLTVAALVALAVWGVPAMVRLATVLGEIKSANQVIEQEDTIPPFAPQISLPYEATSSSQITVTGYAEAESQVVLYVNGNVASEQITDDEGVFDFRTVSLTQGENILTAQAADAAGNKSDFSAEKSVWFDNQKPEITITSPETNGEYISEDKVLNVEGETKTGSRVYVNERLARTDSEGKFSGQTVLEEGENQVKVSVIDRAGNENQIEFGVKYYE